MIEERLRKLVPAAHADDLFVRNEPHVLPGVITVGFTGIKDDASHKMNSNDLVSKALAGPVTAAEVQKAKEAVKSLWAGRGTVDLWLDADTFQIAGIVAYTKVPDAVTLADVQAYAERVRQQPMAVVLVNTPSKE